MNECLGAIDETFSHLPLTFRRNRLTVHLANSQKRGKPVKPKFKERTRGKDHAIMVS